MLPIAPGLGLQPIKRIALRFELSTNGTEWERPVLQGEGDRGGIEYLFPKPAKARSIRILQLGETPGTFWLILELQVLGAVKK